MRLIFMTTKANTSAAGRGRPFSLEKKKEVKKKEDVPLVEFMYHVFTRLPGESYVGGSSLCCCTCVMYFDRGLSPSCVDSLEKS